MEAVWGTEREEPQRAGGNEAAAVGGSALGGKAVVEPSSRTGGGTVWEMSEAAGWER